MGKIFVESVFSKSSRSSFKTVARVVVPKYQPIVVGFENFLKIPKANDPYKRNNVKLSTLIVALGRSDPGVDRLVGLQRTNEQTIFNVFVLDPPS